MGRNDRVTVTVALVRETDAAFLLSDGDLDQWVPKSQCEIEYLGDDTVMVSMPEWLAEDRGFI